MAATPDLNEVITRYTSSTFTDATPLTEAGLASLSVFRIVAALCPDPALEINVESLSCVRTVSELKQWLSRMLVEPVGDAAE